MTLSAIKQAWATEVRRRRIASGRSQTALAIELGSSQSRVAKIESGDPSVSCDLLLRALLVLGVEPAAVADIGQGVAPASGAVPVVATLEPESQPEAPTASELPGAGESGGVDTSPDTGRLSARPRSRRFRAVALRGRRG